jgi:hypothetical protein
LLCIDNAALSSLVERTLPLRAECNLSDCINEIEVALDWYTRLKAAHGQQLSSKLIRQTLKEGSSIVTKLESWMAKAEGSAVRDYVLSALLQELKQRDLTGVPHRIWKEQSTYFQEWRALLDRALSLVQSDRGAPENFALKLLVRDLARVWEKFTGLPFTNTSKGQQRPRDFILAVCTAVDPEVTESQIETAIRSAVSKTSGERRGRKSRRGKLD